MNDYTKYYTWHCGDGNGAFGVTNQNSIGIEICVNSDGDYTKAFENAIELTKQLMNELNIPVERVIRHYDASRKVCPYSMAENSWELWERFKDELVKKEELPLSRYEELKKLIEGKIFHTIEDVPEWAQPTIKKLVSSGLLKGVNSNDLGLEESTMKTLVILDRAGLFK